MMLLDAPEQLRCLRSHLRLVNLTDFVEDTSTNDPILLLLLWMYKFIIQQSNLKLLPTENLQNAFDSTTEQARSDTAWGTGSGVLNR